MFGKFQHPYLDLSQPLIRVVQLVSNSEDGPMRFSMSVINLKARCAAPSYVWGDDDPDEEIYINGEPFKVRKNLLQFLKLSRSKIKRHSARFDPIFIDALCINQSNIAERNHQVRQMNAIYRSASYTIAWLDCGVTNVDKICSITVDAYEYRSYIPWPPTMWRMPGVLEYWSRLWVVPEVCLPRELFFAYGERELHAKALFGLLINTKVLTYSYLERKRADYLQTRGARWRHIIESSNANGFLHMLGSAGNISHLPMSQYISFSTLATAHGLRKCLDPRDRVFALMSMSQDYALWPVSYEDSPIALFKKLQFTIGRKFSIRFAKQVSSMLESDLQVSEADDSADEIEFDGTPIFRFDTWAFNTIYPATSGNDSATSCCLSSGLTRFELQFCKLLETTVSLVILPTDDDVVFSVVGVISGNNVGHAQWLRHRCTIIAESNQALEDFKYRLQYHLMPSSLVAHLELLAAIDMEDLAFSWPNLEKHTPHFYLADK